jgi:Terminase large subunit, T4likevirus-type, N-terminal
MAIELLKHQLDFLKSNYRHTGLVGGFRSGKSQAGVYKTLAKKMMLPKIDVAYYLPTYPLIRDIAYPKFSEILEKQRIPFSLNKSDHDITTPFGRIIMRSMDNPDMIIGYEVGYSLIDEADILSTDKMQEVLIKVLARNSAKYEGNNNATDFVSTPEGFKFMHHFFIKETSENKLLIKAKTKDNPFISDDYIASLSEQYTKEQLEAYLDGEFVNMKTASVYKSYDRIAHFTDEKPKALEMLFVGLDFNITNMNAVVHVLRNQKLYAISEVAGCYDTQTMCETLKLNYPNNRMIINPDASGNARSTSGASDFAILKKNGFIVKAPSKNPSVQERVNSVNLAFQNGKYFVNDKACPKLSESLENQTYKNGVPDKTTGFDHITEAAGYCVVQNLFKSTSISLS